MSSIEISVLVFATVFGGALLGLYLRKILPETHLSSESREIVKLSIGLIATMTALVLGLLVSSVKSSFDSKSNEYNQICANLVLLDRVLAQYGQETAPARMFLKAAVEKRLQELSTRKTDRVTKADAYAAMMGLERLQGVIRGLEPANEAQREIRNHAQHVAEAIVEARWQLLGGVASAVPTVFLVVVVIWLAIIFLSFGLYAPGNSTVVTALFLAALSTAGAIFLVLEMDRPFDGVIHLSEKPLENTASFLGK